MSWDPRGSLIYQALADVTVTNTTVETSILSASRTSAPMVLANKLQPGSEIALYGGFLYNLPLLNAADLTVRIKLGGVTVSTLVVPASIFGGLLQANAPGVATPTLTFRGATKADRVVPAGSLLFDSALTGKPTYKSFLSPTGPVAIDPTVDNPIDVTVQWGTASTAHSITFQVVKMALTI